MSTLKGLVARFKVLPSNCNTFFAPSVRRSRFESPRLPSNRAEALRNTLGLAFVLWSQWKQDAEGGSAIRMRFVLDGPAVFLDNAGSDR